MITVYHRNPAVMSMDLIDVELKLWEPWGNSINIVTRLWAIRPKNSGLVPGWGRDFSLSPCPDQLRPNQPLPGVKVAGA
jgi:hypothetical protein